MSFITGQDALRGANNIFTGKNNVNKENSLRNNQHTVDCLALRYHTTSIEDLSYGTVGPVSQVSPTVPYNCRTSHRLCENSNFKQNIPNMFCHVNGTVY